MDDEEEGGGGPTTHPSAYDRVHAHAPPRTCSRSTNVTMHMHQPVHGPDASPWTGGEKKKKESEVSPWPPFSGHLARSNFASFFSHTPHLLLSSACLPTHFSPTLSSRAGRDARGEQLRSFKTFLRNYFDKCSPVQRTPRALVKS